MTLRACKHGTCLDKDLCLTVSLFYFLELKPALIWESPLDAGASEGLPGQPRSAGGSFSVSEAKATSGVGLRGCLLGTRVSVCRRVGA